MAPHYSIIEDSHCRLFLKEDGYGHVAELLVNPEGEVAVRRMNKGVDMPARPLIDIAEALLRERSTPKKRRRP